MSRPSTRYEISGVRKFCRVYLQDAPDAYDADRWRRCSAGDAGTVQRTLDRACRQLKVTRGRKLRTDGTVVRQTSTHPVIAVCWPTASRFLGRPSAGQNKSWLNKPRWSEVFRNRIRSVLVWPAWLGKPCAGAGSMPKGRLNGLSEADPGCRSHARTSTAGGVGSAKAGCSPGAEIGADAGDLHSQGTAGWLLKPSARACTRKKAGFREDREYLRAPY